MSFNGADPVSFESVSSVTATPSVDVGVIRQEGNHKYIYVYNNGGSQISVGRVATLSAVSGYSVTVSSVSGDVVIGACKHATLTTGTYGWLVVRGFVDNMTNAMASTALAAGDAIQAGVDGGISKGNAAGPSIGKMLSSTGSAGTGSAFIAVF